MSIKEESAINLFKNGLNCAQAVLSSYAKDFNIEDRITNSVSCGFGGGMGRLQETCGAVTGAFMVIGLYNSRKYTDNKERKENAYKMVREFNEKFIGIHKTTNCKLLLNCDLNTEEGQAYVKEHRLHEEICEKCIQTSINILEKLIK